VRRKTLPRHVAACITAIALVAALSACGDEETQELAFELTSQGKGTKISGPASAEPGLAEITLENNADGEGELQLIRVEGDRTPKQVVEGLEEAMQGKPFPEWFFGGGGVGTTPAGQSQAVTQVLEPGTYYAFDVEGNQGPPDPSTLPALEVSGDESDEEVSEPDVTVSAFEYGFDAEELPAGAAEIAFENTGAQPHHLLASRLVGDATVEDVERFFKTEKGKPPLREQNDITTAVLEGDESQLVTVDLKPGRYALLCFVSDREGGPPHAFKGMIDEVEVK
jgi:hypothetical protein